jgi:hypothetical protein
MVPVERIPIKTLHATFAARVNPAVHLIQDA